MKIDQAIENRTTYLTSEEIPKSSADYEATLLSIEALKRIQVCRGDDWGYPFEALPGETKPRKGGS